MKVTEKQALWKSLLMGLASVVREGAPVPPTVQCPVCGNVAAHVPRVENRTVNEHDYPYGSPVLQATHVSASYAAICGCGADFQVQVQQEGSPRMGDALPR